MVYRCWLAIQNDVEVKDKEFLDKLAQKPIKLEFCYVEKCMCSVRPNGSVEGEPPRGFIVIKCSYFRIVITPLLSYR